MVAVGAAHVDCAPCRKWMPTIGSSSQAQLQSRKVNEDISISPMRFLPSASFVATCALLIGCSELFSGTGMISKHIGEVVRTPGSTEVDLAKLTTFGWDKFHVLKPGTTREEVCQLIEAGPDVCGSIVRLEKVPEDHEYLVFGLEGRLTHLELHALENGQFALKSNERGYARARSVFRIRHSQNGSGKDTIHLEPK